MTAGPDAPADVAAKLLAAGLAHHRAGRLAEADRAYRDVLAVAPEHAEALHLRGVLAGQSGRYEEAAGLFGRAVVQNGRRAAYHSNLGAALRELGRFEEAALSCLRALALDPALVDAHANLGAVRHDQNRYRDAETCLRAALARNPGHLGALVSLGAVLRDQGQPAAAEVPLRRALALAPDHGEARWALATTLLVAGRFADGWAAFEARWQRSGLRPRRVAAPRWQGEPLAGRTILLHAEQGRGDTIQFARFVEPVRARGGHPVLQVQPELVALMRTLAGPAAVVPDDGRTPPCDCHCPLLSLPATLGITLETLPTRGPYLAAEPAATAAWRARLDAHARADQRRIGLVWAGTPTHRNDRNRSLPPAVLAPLRAVPNAAFFALQAGPRRTELAAAPGLAGAVVDLGGDLTDFTVTAALLAALDLVITVDTATAHLAGALGRPAWVLLPFAPDWRWLVGRSDSPWYPTLRLFRQPQPGDWPGTVAAVAEALAGAAADGWATATGEPLLKVPPRPSPG